ncbi:hypothetical protein M3Y94_00495500 [Aphelenchoides besseyi]|nr:hypothetical protein M3Y94_00495500 [Aphelenchoides besseyi]KAI6217154.1 hypothetical protein M3Y95_01238700 [Aphelenchoides besseyi]
MSSNAQIQGANGRVVPVPLNFCPACNAPVLKETDKFCRSCGMRILMVCLKCQQNVRPSDKFCFSCGHRRYYWIELWRYGMLHRSAGYIVLSTIAVASAYFGLYVWLKSRGRFK